MKLITLSALAFVLAPGVLVHAADKKAQSATASPELIAKGKESFLKNCVLCHGEKGDGNGPAGAMMNPKPRNFATDKFKNGETAAKVLKVVTEGLKGTAMAGFGHLPADERKALAAYVLSFKKR